MSDAIAAGSAGPVLLKCTCTKVDGTAILTVAGDIDLATHGQLTKAILSPLDDEGVRTVVADFSAVTFLDSSGVHALLEARRHLNDRKVELLLRDPSACARRTLELVGLVEMFMTNE